MKCSVESFLQTGVKIIDIHYCSTKHTVLRLLELLNQLQILFTFDHHCFGVFGFLDKNITIYCPKELVVTGFCLACQKKKLFTVMGKIFVNIITLNSDHRKLFVDFSPETFVKSFNHFFY